MNPTRWHQITIGFPDWAHAEDIAVTHLWPLLATAETDGLITGWFFIRKAPCWRVRYLPADNSPYARTHLHDHLKVLERARKIEHATEAVYEPECHAFGGTEGMSVAHRLWHLDSRHLLAHLAATTGVPATRRRRELLILLSSTMLRAAGLDWYEQGDVWARVADHRDPPDHISTDGPRALHAPVRRLMSVETSSLTSPDAPLASVADWAAAFTCAGNDLAHLVSQGLLRRGLRAILAHHVIFTANRFGLPATTQSVLATAAKTVVFGDDDAPITPRSATGHQPGQHHAGTAAPSAQE